MMHVMSSVQYQNKKVQEPIYELDVTVPTPDLTEDTMYSSNLTFINISEGLNKLIESKIKYAEENFICKMKEQNKDVQAHKNLLRQLEKDGLSVIPAIDANEDYDSIEFKSCGDINKDLKHITSKTMKAQTQLFELDQNYYPIHNEIKKLQLVKHDLDKFTDNYKIQLSQLNRVLKRIGKYIEDNKTTKDSTLEAIKATETQQEQMVNKISEKIIEIENKMKEFTNNNDSEYKKYGEFLRGLREFLAGLSKLRQSSESKISHLDSVVTQLIEQRATINAEIRNLKENAILKLKEIRNKYLKPNIYLISDEYDSKILSEELSLNAGDENKHNNFNAILLPSYNNIHSIHSYSTPIGLIQKREKYMNIIYKKIHNLESRALTTSSSDYLNSLTEIRELKLIFNDYKLKYFYNKFVSSCNQVFND
eukprot:252777_1